MSYINREWFKPFKRCAPFKPFKSLNGVNRERTDRSVMSMRRITMLHNQIWAPLILAIVVFSLPGRVVAAQLDWKADWERTVAAAKKEGQVNVYIYRYEGLLQDFKRDFPGINVVAVSGRGNELTTRLMSERRAGKYHRRCLQRRPGRQLQRPLQRQSSRSDQAAVEPARSRR